LWGVLLEKKGLAEKGFLGARGIGGVKGEKTPVLGKREMPRLETLNKARKSLEPGRKTSGGGDLDKCD